MKILVACEYSGTVRDAFDRRGHDVISCDFLATESPGRHYRGDVVDILYSEKWDMLIAFPPCTYMCNSGVRWMDTTRYTKCMEASVFFYTLWHSRIEKICIENPIPHKYAALPAYSQIIQPWMFGHGERKATCLWLKNLSKLKPTNIVSGRKQRIYLMPPSKDRGKLRAKTYPGIAQAMCDQWG